jgi:hypothetical protein
MTKLDWILIELKGFLVVYYVLRERGEREKEGKRTVERE